MKSNYFSIFIKQNSFAKNRILCFKWNLIKTTIFYDSLAIIYTREIQCLRMISTIIWIIGSRNHADPLPLCLTVLQYHLVSLKRLDAFTRISFSIHSMRSHRTCLNVTVACDTGCHFENRRCEIRRILFRW